MADFIYNYHSGVSWEEQKYNFYQAQEFQQDSIRALQTYQENYNQLVVKENDRIVDTFEKVQNKMANIVGAIHDLSYETNTAITQSANRIDLSLREGFKNLDARLKEFTEGLSWQMAQIIDNQKVTNLISGNIAQLLRIPDIQKERQYHIEQGFKHYQNAQIDASLFEDSLENLLKAEEREKTDYVVLHRIGMIYLYHQKNYAKAVFYFERAAKYAAVESDPNAVTLANILAHNVYEDFTKQSVDKNAVQLLASSAFFEAAKAHYLLKHFENAYQSAVLASQKNNHSLDIHFHIAKYAAASGKKDECTQKLREVITKNRLYATKTVLDTDLASQNYVHQLLGQMRDEVCEKLATEIKRLKSQFANYQNGDFEKDLNFLKNQLDKNNYLEALGALDLIASIEKNVQVVVKLDTEKERLSSTYALYLKGDFAKDIQTRKNAIDTCQYQECHQLLSEVQNVEKNVQKIVQLDREIQRLETIYQKDTNLVIFADFNYLKNNFGKYEYKEAQNALEQTHSIETGIKNMAELGQRIRTANLHKLDRKEAQKQFETIEKGLAQTRYEQNTEAQNAIKDLHKQIVGWENDLQSYRNIAQNNLSKIENAKISVWKEDYEQWIKQHQQYIAQIEGTQKPNAELYPTDSEIEGKIEMKEKLIKEFKLNFDDNSKFIKQIENYDFVSLRDFEVFSTNLLNEKKRKEIKRYKIVASLMLAITVVSASLWFYNAWKIEENLWLQVSNAHNYQIVAETYINEYPNGRYIEQAKIIAEDELWASVKDHSPILYLNKYPNGRYVGEVKKSNLFYYEEFKGRGYPEDNPNNLFDKTDASFCFEYAESAKRHAETNYRRAEGRGVKIRFYKDRVLKGIKLRNGHYNYHRYARAKTLYLQFSNDKNLEFLLKDTEKTQTIIFPKLINTDFIFIIVDVGDNGAYASKVYYSEVVRNIDRYDVHIKEMEFLFDE